MAEQNSKHLLEVFPEYDDIKLIEEKFPSLILLYKHHLTTIKKATESFVMDDLKKQQLFSEVFDGIVFSRGFNATQIDLLVDKYQITAVEFLVHLLGTISVSEAEELLKRNRYFVDYYHGTRIRQNFQGFIDSKTGSTHFDMDVYDRANSPALLFKLTTFIGNKIIETL